MKYEIITDGKSYALKRSGFLKQEEFLDVINEDFWWPKESSYNFLHRCWTFNRDLLELYIKRLSA